LIAAAALDLVELVAAPAGRDLIVEPF